MIWLETLRGGIKVENGSAKMCGLDDRAETCHESVIPSRF
jgi:hypothetical protein